MEGLLSTEDRIDYLQGTVTAQRVAGDAMRRQMDLQRQTIDSQWAQIAKLKGILADRETQLSEGAEETVTQRLRIDALEARLAVAAQMDADLRAGLMRIARRADDLNRPDVCQQVAEVLGMDTQELHRAMAK